MADTTTTDAGGYSRIQHSIGTAADWEKYNPAIRPGELAVVIKTDGNVMVKINKTMNDMKYADLPVIWDQGVAAQLQTNLADAQKAASAATDAKNAAQTYAQQAEATANAIKEKSILAITDSVQLAVNTEDGGLDIVITTE
ncbi:hypothetical protein [Megasphaera sp.]|jgi:hypothetical protein|uniref:hypothetical protein n=1 Tax=Megasphaera sp. TaxID=2023260 RepID=UPI0035219D4D